MNPTKIAWVSLGPIKSKAVPQNVPEEPGLYKLTFALWGSSYAYIGEAGQLRRRICEYACNPTQGNKMEHLLFHLLAEAGEAELSICRCVGLESEDARRSIESDAIAEARQEGLACLNRGKSDDIRMQRFRLKSEERMLSCDLKRVRAKLAKLSQ
jgi:hypothetical protein